MVCNKCRIDRNLDYFSFRNKQKQLRTKICKVCHSEYRKQHYLQNKEKYVAKARKWNKIQGQTLKKFLFETLSESKCIDCGETDIVVLEFDHIGKKRLGLAEMYKNRYSLQKVKEEIAQCVVRCANCHRRKTAKESGFWKFKMLKV